MKHYTIQGYTVDCLVENVYYDLAAKFISDNDNFYVPRLLKYMISVEAAEVCLQMPGTPEEIAELLGWDLDKVNALVKEAIVNGVAHRNFSNGKINFAQNIVNIADFGSVNPWILTKRGPGFLDLMKGIRTSKEYEDSFTEELNNEKVEASESDKEREPLFRILPRWDAIKNIPGVMPCEDLHAILNEQDKISTARCMCRTVMRGADEILEGTQPEEGHCIKFGTVARHFVEDMELGSYMTVDETIALLDGIKDQPLYHMIGNSREVKGGFCNCCSDCCDMRNEANHLPQISDGIKPSRFLTIVDKDECKGCGKCHSLCPFDAIKLNSENSETASDGSDCSNSLVHSVAKVDAKKCMGCGICVVNCKSEALSMVIVRPVEFIPADGPQHIFDSLNWSE